MGILAGVDASIGPIVCHGAVEPLNRAYRAAGIALPDTLAVGEVADKADLKRALVLCPGSALGSPWIQRFGDFRDAFASGWMQVRGQRRRGYGSLRARAPCAARPRNRRSSSAQNRI